MKSHIEEKISLFPFSNRPFFYEEEPYRLRAGRREGAHMVPHSSRYYSEESIFEESLFVLVRLGGRNLDERGK